jgi:catechol 2,3-dioxygenase-like lactoylglutathione lyase family enzyme
MTLAPYHHIGVLVADLDEAVTRFQTVMGLNFVAPRLFPIEVEEDGRRYRHTTRVTFSQEGPPHIELMESAPNGIFSIGDRGEGFHHVGIWIPHLDEHLGGAAEIALPAAARVIGAGERTREWFNRPEDLHGLRLEFLEADGFWHFSKWIDSSDGGPDRDAAAP